MRPVRILGLAPSALTWQSAIDDESTLISSGARGGCGGVAGQHQLRF